LIDFPKTGEAAVYHLGLKAGELASRIVGIFYYHVQSFYYDSLYCCCVLPLPLPLPASNSRFHFSPFIQITVGDPARAQGIAKLLDPEPKPFALHSERGFLTLTGKYKGVAVSIVAIGMGAPNMDFFVRECREILDDSGGGDMVIIRWVGTSFISTFLVLSLPSPCPLLHTHVTYGLDLLTLSVISDLAHVEVWFPNCQWDH
jgi:uridine phosphorylase